MSVMSDCILLMFACSLVCVRLYALYLARPDYPIGKISIDSTEPQPKRDLKHFLTLNKRPLLLAFSSADV